MLQKDAAWGGFSNASSHVTATCPFTLDKCPSTPRLEHMEGDVSTLHGPK